MFKDNGLFLLPVKNGEYAIVKGEGYVDIPGITNSPTIYKSKLEFELKTAMAGDSEMQHLDFAYAVSLIRSFTNDPTLVLTIRGRKYSPRDGFLFCVGAPKTMLQATSVQTEVDAGYEGKEQVVLVEAKGAKATDVIIRQLYYPYRQWKMCSGKKVRTLFFQHNKDTYSIWEFEFADPNDYNSIRFCKSATYKIE